MFVKSQWLKGLAAAAAVLSASASLANTYPTDIHNVTLYSPNSKTYFSSRNVVLPEDDLPELPIEGKVRYPKWVKIHHSQLGNSGYGVSDINVAMKLVDDKDNNGCISNNDLVEVSDAHSGAYLVSKMHSFFASYTHVVKHVFEQSPETITPYQVTGMDKACVGWWGVTKMQLKSTLPETINYFWNNRNYPYNVGGHLLQDSRGNSEFLLSMIGNSANNQEPLHTIQAHVTNEAVTILSHQSSFITADGQGYLPTINGASDKWEILGAQEGSVLRHYCIPDGTAVVIKNHGTGKFLAQTNWTFGPRDWRTEYIIENRKYPGACIEATDAFSLRAPNGNYVQSNKAIHPLDSSSEFNYRTNTFAFARNPDLDFQVNKANLSIEIKDGSYQLGSHEDNTMTANGAADKAFPLSESVLKGSPAGVAMQYSFHSKANSFCDDSSFFLKRAGSPNAAKFFGSSTDGMGKGGKIYTNKPHVLSWESFRFDFMGDDENACYTPNEQFRYRLQSNGLLTYSSWYKRSTKGGNQMRMWNPTEDRLGHFSTYFYINGDSYIRTLNLIDWLPEYQGLIDVGSLPSLRYYFDDADNSANYRTELAITALKTHDGRYVSAVNAGGDDVNALGQILQIWEALTFEPVNRLDHHCYRGGSEVYIRTNNGHIIKANEYDDSVDSRTHNRITWEKFTIEFANGNANNCVGHGSKIKLRTYHGTYLKAVNGNLVHSAGNDTDESTLTVMLNNSPVS